MKKSFRFLAASAAIVSMFAVSCGKAVEPEPNPGQDPDPDPVEYVLSVSTSEIQLEAADSVASFNIASNVAWAVECTGDVVATPSSGENDGTVSLSFAPNTGLTAVEYTVTVSSSQEGVKPCTIVLKQKGTALTFAEIVAKGEGSYSAVNAQVVAVGSSQVVLTDGTAYIFAYNSKKDVVLGATYTVVGEVKKYNGCDEWNDPKFTLTAEASEVKHPEAETLTAESYAAYTQAPSIKYVSYTGTKAGYILSGEGVALNVYSNDKLADGEYTIEGYMIGYSSSKSNVNLVAAKATCNALTTTITVAGGNEVKVGATLELGATASSKAALTYASSAETVATVSAEGVVTGVAEGEAVITISAPAVEGYTAATKEYKVTVKAADASEPSYIFFEDFSSNTWRGDNPVDVDGKTGPDTSKDKTTSNSDGAISWWSANDTTRPLESKLSAVVNVFWAREGFGVKLGTGSKTGSLSTKALDLSKPFKITVEAASYSASEVNDFYIKIGETEVLSNVDLTDGGTSNKVVRDVVYEGKEGIADPQIVTIGTKTKRCYVNKIVIENL